MTLSFWQLLAIVLGVIAYLVHVIFQKDQWREVYTATGDKIPKAQRVYNYLESSGIKCKLKTKSPVARSRLAPVFSHRLGIMTVLVKKEDEYDAFRLMRELDNLKS